MYRRLLLLLPAALAHGAALPFRLASIFGNGMVLQRNAPVTIWGFAAPSTAVFGTLTDLVGNATFNASGVATPDGVWALTFPPQTGGYNWRLSVSDSPEAPVCALYPFYCEGAFAEITGVLFGDVIACVRASSYLPCARPEAHHFS